MFFKLKDGRVKSSAMFYALFLMTVVSIIIAGLFQLSDLNKMLASKFEFQDILVKKSKSGLNSKKCSLSSRPPWFLPITDKNSKSGS